MKEGAHLGMTPTAHLTSFCSGLCYPFTVMTPRSHTPICKTWCDETPSEMGKGPHALGLGALHVNPRVWPSPSDPFHDPPAPPSLWCDGSPKPRLRPWNFGALAPQRGQALGWPCPLPGSPSIHILVVAPGSHPFVGETLPFRGPLGWGSGPHMLTLVAQSLPLPWPPLIPVIPLAQP